MTNETKIRQLLNMLGMVQEQLLSLPDDMLLSINPRENESLAKGTAFIQNYNITLAKFCKNAIDLERQVKDHFNVNPEDEDTAQESISRTQRDRVITELDKTKPHSINENFTYKRPFGFTLGEHACQDIKTWRSLYLKILKVLEETDLDKFANLPNDSNFITSHGNSMFASSENSLRYAYPFSEELFIELNLSAENIRRNIIALLEVFGFAADDIKIYLREDRDALPGLDVD